MNTTSFEELNSFVTKYNTDSTIASLTPTICALMGTREPNDCGAVELSAVVDQAARLTGKENGIEKALIFCPDAVGEVQRARFPELLDRVKKLAGFQYSCASVMPSVTPVCFGSIFSGASPAVHGIQKYEKPVLTIETLFDVLAEAGRSVAIVAINNCSIDCIFRKRNVDYYSLRTDQGSFELTRELIASNKYDVIISYYTSYDHLSHHHGSWSKEAVDALNTSVEYFETLVADTEKYWSAYNRVITWTPDHGNHVIDETSGGHGHDIADDMVVNHYYRVKAAN